LPGPAFYNKKDAHAVNQLIEINDIARRISTIRGIKVMIDRDLAEFYRVQCGSQRINRQGFCAASPSSHRAVGAKGSELRESAMKNLERIRWFLWHGNSCRTLQTV
jgi:hypothetical protein